MDIIAMLKRNRIVLGVAAFVSFIVFVSGDGAHFIFTALGAALVLGGYTIVQRLAKNPAEGKKYLVTGAIVLTAIVTTAINSDISVDAVGHTVTGIGGTGLMLVMFLLFKHFWADGSK
ncbi:hypothetical protein [Actinomadura sp. NPDC049753]|uniref:hypothetical protein n=1 Tax=Actinomadura sp. NPDC049753 TaxID=3154739 RepID=UPI0034361EA9